MRIKLFLLFLSLTAIVYAETSLRTEIQSIANASYLDEKWYGYGMAKSSIHIRSVGNASVRGALRLSIWANTDEINQYKAPLDFSIERAYMQFRIPIGENYQFRILSGKARISWGEGALFNASDVLFGSSSSNPDFLSETIRDESTWLLASFFPLGNFAFFEPFISLPITIPSLLAETMQGQEGDEDSSPDNSLNPAHLKTGGRVQTEAGPLKLEFGYLYSGKEALHIPTFAMQFNLGIDWYASVSSRLYDPLPENFNDVHISAGFLHLQNVGVDYQLSIRGETLVMLAEEEYSLFVDTSLVRSTYSVLLRAMYAFHSDTALLSLGYSFTAIEGLSVSPYINWAPSSDRLSDTSLSLLLRYIF